MHIITTTQLAEAAPANLIDVREPDEFAAGHVPGARNIPLATVPDHLEELRALDDLHLICQVGGRSGRAVAFLEHHGVEATNVDGGTGAWIAEGRPVEA
ncbi:MULTISPECIES: rhodanese-like domain-containing protein [unclassified Microbacterium]|uniref:rhodanese-like domain-containing protein n=1 Tax=unclassified Microbacterium TaxID=2609290 RepID=UPI0038689633